MTIPSAAIGASSGADGEALAHEPPRGGKSGLNFNELLLIGVAALIFAATALGFILYALPVPHLQVAELQPSIRVAPVTAMPSGSSRVVTWGATVVLVVRTGESSYAALRGTSPVDGCILEWDNASMLVRSPCHDVRYDLHGNVVRGLTTTPLERYTVFVRQGDIYVTGT